MSKTVKMVWQGHIVLHEQEGGYCSPAIEVDGVNVTREIEDGFNLLSSLRIYGHDCSKPKGIWRLTLENVGKG